MATFDCFYIALCLFRRRTGMKIVVLGPKGNLGQEIVAADERHGHEVVGLEVSALETMNPGVVSDSLASLSPEAIINATAYNGVDEAEKKENQVLAWRLNAEIPTLLAKAALSLDVPLVHY